MVNRDARSALLIGVLAALVILSGCDKKASIATQQQARVVQAQAAVVARLSESIVGKVVAVDGHSNDYIREVVENISETFKLLSYGTQRLASGLDKKSALSVETATQIAEGVETVKSEMELIRELKSRVKPQTGADSEGVAVWMNRIEVEVQALIDASTRLAALVQADVQAQKK